MKQQINEIKRMQQLAGIISENNSNPYNNPIIASVRAEGEYTDITPDTQVEIGDDVVSLKGYFGTVKDIQGDKYKILYHSDGTITNQNRKKLESFFLVRK